MDQLELWKGLQIGELLERINQIFPGMHISAAKLLEMLLQGDLSGVGQALLEQFHLMFSVNWQSVKELFVSILLMGVISAFFVQFSEVTDCRGVSEISHCLVYLIQATILAKCFTYFFEITKAALENIILFVRLLMPLYLLAVSVATGTFTAGAGGQMILWLVYCVEKLFQKAVLPAVTFFFLLAVMEGVEGADRWDAMLDLIKKTVEGLLKLLLGAIAAMGFLQALLMPALDNLKGTAVQRILCAVPGIGNGAEGALRLALSSAIVMKNSIGILLLLLLLLLCGIPLLRILVLALCLKAAAAVMGIVSDNRLSKVVERSGEAGILLFRITGCAMLLFWVVIAVSAVCVRQY